MTFLENLLKLQSKHLQVSHHIHRPLCSIHNITLDSFTTRTELQPNLQMRIQPLATWQQ